MTATASSGNWFDSATWVGGVVPTFADDVTIAPAHTVIINGHAECRNLALQGAVIVDNTQSTSMSVERSIYGYNYTTAEYSCDLSADPTVTHDIRLNKSGQTNQTVNSNIHFYKSNPLLSLRGFYRKRLTYISTDLIAGVSESVEVVDATGWQIGDIIVFSSTSAYSLSAPAIDQVVITDVNDNVISWVGAVSFNHSSADFMCSAGNFTSNVTISPYAQGDQGVVYLNLNGAMQPHVLENICFSYLWSSSNTSSAALTINTAKTTFPNLIAINGCAFYNYQRGAVRIINTVQALPASADCVFYSTYNQTNSTYADAWFDSTRVSISEYGFFRSSRGSNNLGLPAAGALLDVAGAGTVIDKCHFSGASGSSVLLGGVSVSINSCKSVSNYAEIALGDASCTINEWIAQANTRATWTVDDAAALIEFDDAMVSTQYIDNIASALDVSKITFTNKNKNVLQHEMYTPLFKLTRNNTEFYRSTSSIAITPAALGRDCAISRTIASSAGSTSTIVGYIKFDSAFYNSSDFTPPSVVLSGLGEADVVHSATSAANNAWEKYTISITNNSGSDGNFLLTFMCNAKSTIGGTVFFDGVTIDPYVTKARHYGYVFNETFPVRTLDPYAVADEVTAASYSGIAIDNNNKTITLTAGTAETAQNFYDYLQAYYAANLDYSVSIKRAGSLYQLSQDWVVIEPRYAGQLTWSGGTIRYLSAGEYSDSLDSVTIEFLELGTYSFGGAKLTGTLTLVNGSAGNITVELPADVDFVNTDVSSITTTQPLNLSKGQISGLTAGSRVRIYNVTDGVETFNDIVTSSEYIVDYAAGDGYSSGDIVEVYTAWSDGVTALLPDNYVALVTSSGWSVLAQQHPDEVYNFNAIDGSAANEFTADFPNVQIDINDIDGVTTPQRGYAWYIYNQTTADGIRYYHGAMTAEDALNYRINVDISDMRIQNISANPLQVVGARLYRSDGSNVTIAGNGPIEMEHGRVYALETGVSGLTSSESAKLLSIPVNPVLDSDARLDHLDADISSITGATPAEIWTYSSRELTVASGLTSAQEAKLDAIPTTDSVADLTPVLDAISSISTGSVDEVALASAIVAGIERDGGMLDLLPTDPWQIAKPSSPIVGTWGHYTATRLLTSLYFLGNK